MNTVRQVNENTVSQRLGQLSLNPIHILQKEENPIHIPKKGDVIACLFSYELSQSYLNIINNLKKTNILLSDINEKILYRWEFGKVLDVNDQSTKIFWYEDRLLQTPHIEKEYNNNNLPFLNENEIIRSTKFMKEFLIKSYYYYFKYDTIKDMLVVDNLDKFKMYDLYLEPYEYKENSWILFISIEEEIRKEQDKKDKEERDKKAAEAKKIVAEDRQKVREASRLVKEQLAKQKLITGTKRKPEKSETPTENKILKIELDDDQILAIFKLILARCDTIHDFFGSRNELGFKKIFYGNVLKALDQNVYMNEENINKIIENILETKFIKGGKLKRLTLKVINNDIHLLLSKGYNKLNTETQKILPGFFDKKLNIQINNYEKKIIYIIENIYNRLYEKDSIYRIGYQYSELLNGNIKRTGTDNLNEIENFYGFKKDELFFCIDATAGEKFKNDTGPWEYNEQSINTYCSVVNIWDPSPIKCNTIGDDNKLFPNDLYDPNDLYERKNLQYVFFSEGTSDKFEIKYENNQLDVKLNDSPYMKVVNQISNSDHGIIVNGLNFLIECVSNKNKKEGCPFYSDGLGITDNDKNMAFDIKRSGDLLQVVHLKNKNNNEQKNKGKNLYILVTNDLLCFFQARLYQTPAIYIGGKLCMYKPTDNKLLNIPELQTLPIFSHEPKKELYLTENASVDSISITREYIDKTIQPCEVCGGQGLDDKDSFPACDFCDYMYHTVCLDRQEFKGGAWHCNICKDLKKCNIPFVENYKDYIKKCKKCGEYVDGCDVTVNKNLCCSVPGCNRRYHISCLEQNNERGKYYQMDNKYYDLDKRVCPVCYFSEKVDMDEFILPDDKDKLKQLLQKKKTNKLTSDEKNEINISTPICRVNILEEYNRNAVVTDYFTQKKESRFKYDDSLITKNDNLNTQCDKVDELMLNKLEKLEDSMSGGSDIDNEKINVFQNIYKIYARYFIKFNQKFTNINILGNEIKFITNEQIALLNILKDKCNNKLLLKDVYYVAVIECVYWNIIIKNIKQYIDELSDILNGSTINTAIKNQNKSDIINDLIDIITFRGKDLIKIEDSIFIECMFNTYDANQFITCEYFEFLKLINNIDINDIQLIMLNKIDELKKTNEIDYDNIKETLNKTSLFRQYRLEFLDLFSFYVDGEDYSDVKAFKLFNDYINSLESNTEVELSEEQLLDVFNNPIKITSNIIKNLSKYVYNPYENVNEAYITIQEYFDFIMDNTLDGALKSHLLYIDYIVSQNEDKFYSPLQNEDKFYSPQNLPSFKKNVSPKSSEYYLTTYLPEYAKTYYPKNTNSIKSSTYNTYNSRSPQELDKEQDLDGFKNDYESSPQEFNSLKNNTYKRNIVYNVL
jgi:hypothetical protein